MAPTVEIFIRIRGLLAAAMLVIATLVFAGSVPATSARAQQVVVIVNGDPVTALDIEQRTKLIQLSTPEESRTARGHRRTDQ